MNIKEQNINFGQKKFLTKIKYNQNKLIPAIAQAKISRQVLMMAWMNEEAILQTIKTGFVHYWSRSRSKLWLKGETSGNTQKLISLTLDCDYDTILLSIEQKGVACHTGKLSCFYNLLKLD